MLLFFENRSLIMSKLTTTLPTENENINLKGRKGTVLSVEKLDDKHINVHVALEKVIKKSAVL
ncbi:Preprotein translocase subunit SecA OS=Ureibacillus acetophenoni OX=614649 GN=SAMN05877842_103225 PE=4 SV=1 [Ureibacillus acetophenoni]